MILCEMFKVDWFYENGDPTYIVNLLEQGLVTLVKPQNKKGSS